MPTLVKNKGVLNSYEILEKFEGGLKLTGPEVKSVRAGHMKLTGSYLSINGKQIILKNAHIGRYAPAGQDENYDSERPRVILINKQELLSLDKKLQGEGLTIVPISVYTKGNFLKLEFGLARGKKLFEKRDDMKKKAVKRQIQQELKKTRFSD